MRKCYLFLLMLLSPLAAIFNLGNAFAADPPNSEYEAALRSFKDGVYFIVTEVNDVRYYVTSDGLLTEYEEDGCKFEITKSGGGGLKEYGFRINIPVGENGERFTNSALVDNKAKLDQDFFSHSTNDRTDWERQVFFMNAEGKIAIRTCNTAYAETSWEDSGRSFWTYKIADPMDENPLPTPCYSYTPAYIWTLLEPAPKDAIYVIMDGLCRRYSAVQQDDVDYPTAYDIGSEPGQCADVDTWVKLWNLIQNAYSIGEKMLDDNYDYYADPNAITVDEANAMAAAADSMHQKILDSEVPYVPEDGYYRIYTAERYKSKYDESGFVDKAWAASFEKAHANKGVYGTVKKNLANFIWKITKSENGDSLMLQNAGMGGGININRKMNILSLHRL